MTDKQEPELIRQLRAALANPKPPEPEPLFGYCHPDNYERYSKFIAEYLMPQTKKTPDA